MLTEEQSQVQIEGVTAQTSIMMLQIISRANARACFMDHELSAVGTVRDLLKNQLLKTTGVDYDQAMVQLHKEHEKATQKAAEKAGNSESTE